MEEIIRGVDRIACKDSPQGTRSWVGGRGGGGSGMRLEVQLRVGRRKVKRAAILAALLVLFPPKLLRTVEIVVMLSKAKEWKKRRNRKVVWMWS